MSRGLLKNAAWGMLGEVATRGAKIAQVILIARVLGAEEVGRFNYALAMAGLFSVLFDFGVVTVAVKELAWAPRGAALRLYGRVKLLSSTAGVVLIAGATLLMPMSPHDRYLAFGLGLYLALNDFSTYVVVAYRARGEFWRETAWRAVFALMQLAACAAALFLTHQVDWVAIALVVTAAFGMVPLVREWMRQPPVGGGDVGLAGIAKALLKCVPVAGSVLAGTVYMNFDVVVLGRNVAMAEVGWYSVAVKAIFGLLIMPLHYLQLATLPAFAAELGGDSSAATRNRWLRGFVLSTTAGGLLSLCTAVVARDLLTFLFGAEFAAGEPVLVAFVLIGFLFYLYTPLAQWLLLLGRQRWTLYVQALAMVANIAFVLAWVPRWGIWGAVLAAGTTHAIIALGLFLLVWHVDGSTRRESDWWSLLRVTVGITLGVCALQLGGDWGVISRAAAVVLFVVCAHREIVALARQVHARIRLQ